MDILKTERLILSEASTKDAAFYYEFMNTATWLKFIGDRGINSIENAKTYIQNKIIKGYQKDGYGVYKIRLKSNNKPIGACGLVNRKELPNVDIGFALLPHFEGKAYAYEAAKAVLKYAKEKLHITTILAITLENNTASIKLLNKLGLSFQKKIKFELDGNNEFLLFST